MAENRTPAEFDSHPGGGGTRAGRPGQGRPGPPPEGPGGRPPGAAGGRGPPAGRPPTGGGPPPPPPGAAGRRPSRSLLLTLQPLGDGDMREVIGRALADERGLGGTVTLQEDAAEHLVRLSGGDARRALTYLEAAALGVRRGGSIDSAALERAVERAAVRHDRARDQHYHGITPFLKSTRRRDPDPPPPSPAR